MNNIDRTSDRVFLNPDSQKSESNGFWWNRYMGEVEGLTSTAREVLEVDCNYILSRGVLGDGTPDLETWPQSGVRTGLVMGSVQSGKTASMLGVTALALDHGIDIVVILAGTRVSLWRQTYERLSGQLDSGPDGVAKASRRIMCPKPGVALSDASASLKDTYRLSSAQVRRALAAKKPLIVVAMKQTSHLHALGRVLRDSVFDAIGSLGRSAHMLVLDDEADDGSVLDAAVEAGQDPISGNLKQIPRAIADLWDPRAVNAPSNLFATYIGYTATPQANLLQEDHNPLAPRDFVISLRTPFDDGIPVEIDDADAARSSTYPEPSGIDKFYTGGEVFYRRGASARLCSDLTGDAEYDLGESIRAYLVAGAIQLSRSATPHLGPHSVSKMQFDSKADVARVSPAPHSMLFHPSADINGHFKGAEDVLLWAGVADRQTARTSLESGVAYLPTSLIGKMYDEESAWTLWLDRYRESAEEIETEFNVLNPRSIPDWSTVRSILETEIIPATRVSVVNSDPAADDRPKFSPIVDSDTGRWRAAPDLATIFVSGNVMARGLTLEGLTTALFQRESANPFADTQMQMQRWFGYRGPYIELCRLFAPRSQIDLFRSYHDVDEAIRIAISESMETEAPAPVVLHGLQFLATGKIANLRRRPLCPSSKPFLTLINDGVACDPNVRQVADLFSNGASYDVVVGGIRRGRRLCDTLSLTEAAGFLSSLHYDAYNPSSNGELGEYWSQLQARVESVRPLSSGEQFYTPPERQTDDPSAPRRNCPYAISAYLRLWSACLTRPVRGLFVTGAPAELWSMADLREKAREEPRFSIGIRYGAGKPIIDGPLANLGFNIMSTNKRVGGDGDLETRWGANDPNAGPLDYRGDEFFDYYGRSEGVPEISSGESWRPTGSNGQILLYVNQLPGQPHPTLAVGLCIPSGGPEQFAATRASRIPAA